MFSLLTAWILSHYSYTCKWLITCSDAGATFASACCSVATWIHLVIGFWMGFCWGYASMMIFSTTSLALMLQGCSGNFTGPADPEKANCCLTFAHRPVAISPASSLSVNVVFVWTLWRCLSGFLVLVTSPCPDTNSEDMEVYTFWRCRAIWVTERQRGSNVDPVFKNI